ncbi:MMPL family transporter [Streptomyces aidingensis]|uniref:Putative drug exporter of the RND superfamily n=1 Tax=Streptomyces aidingensis TaxID=910347 RepID=A0A1I1N5J2_9ACTN|nr:MMPL family transporter [Streptomyces aidingensis]SFC92941.1 putative drug exporter of the RND superfamily [Streptomyces aidingensis]
MSVGTSEPLRDASGGARSPEQAERRRTLADRTAAVMVRRRRPVMLLWLVIILAAAPLAATLSGALSGAGWTARGSESEQVRDELRRDFPELGAEAAVVVVQAPAGSEPDAAVGEIIAALDGREGVAGLTDPRTRPAEAGLVSEDGRTALVPVRLTAEDEAGLPEAAAEVRDTVEDTALPPSVTAEVTGEWPVWADFNESNEQAMLRAELLSGLPVMILLVVVFGSLVAAGLPMMLAMAGIATGYAALHLITFATPLSVWSMNFSMMIGMAIGIDYSLFIVTRYRAERARGAGTEAALARTLATSGKAILLSALALVMALGAVFLLPVMVFRSMALGMILAVVAVSAAAVTLLPAVLAALGDRVLRGRAGRTERSETRWRRWSAVVVRRPVTGLLAGAVLLTGLSGPVAGVELGMPGARVVDTGWSSRDGYETLTDAFGPGAAAPLYLTAPEAGAPAVLEELTGRDGVAQAGVVTEPAEDSGRVVIRAVPATAIDDDRTADLVADLREDLGQTVPDARVGGPAAQNHDMTRALAASAPWIIALVLAMSLLMMLIVFRSPAIALVTIVMNLLTVAAAFGIAAIIFQHGIGAGLIGIDHQGFINAWAPVFFFAILFGLSMDYQLFLLAAVRERYELSGDTRQAVREGIAVTGRPITNAAVIMVIVFTAFGVTGPIPPTELGVTLAIAVILDATVVRMLVVPASLTLLGERTWWIPRALDKALPSVTFRH